MLRSHALLFLCLVFATSVSAKEWRGLVPLKSTQADARRILGSSMKDVEGVSVYKSADVIAVITYQLETCDSHMGKFGFGWNVPKGSIGVIGLIPLTRQTIEDYGVRSSFKEEKHGGGFVYYSNDAEGLRVETLDGLVTNVTYLPTSKEDESLGCPMVQKCCWDMFPTIDEFSKRPRNETIARLDNLFVNVQHDFSRAVIIVSGPTGKRQAEMGRLKSLGSLRIKKYEIEPQRFLIADGGYSEDFRTQLQIYPIASVINWVWIHPEPDPQPRKTTTKARK
jgi:hypothetical protein